MLLVYEFLHPYLYLLGILEETRACRQLADSQAWLELLRDAADSG
jgi:hypothetical protein